MPDQQALSPEIKLAYGECERRLRTVRTDFLSATRRLENTERRNALFATYVSLRVMAPATLPRPAGVSPDVDAFERNLSAWLDDAARCHRGEPDPTRPDQVALAHAMQRFSIPLDGWEQLAQGLREVGRAAEVPDVKTYLRQGKLLSMSNTSVFLGIVIAKEGHRRYHNPGVNIEDIAYHPALFAYTVRVMLDVLEEPTRSRDARTSIPTDLLKLHNLDLDNLLEFRDLAYAPREFFELMNDLASLAWQSYESGVTKLTQVASCLTSEAVRHVDYAMGQYRATLKAMEELKFAPAELNRLRIERGWRHGAHRAPAGAGDADGRRAVESSPPPA